MRPRQNSPFLCVLCDIKISQSKDDFAINETSLLANAFTKVFEVVNQAGLFIGIFSILVGGIGILNIMLVSVRERRVYIGIKALGAKRYVIMLEFLIEAVMLCLIGGRLRNDCELWLLKHSQSCYRTKWRIDCTESIPTEYCAWSWVIYSHWSASRSDTRLFGSFS